MAEGLNKVMLLGNLGEDPELRSTQGGSSVLKIRIATNDRYKDKEGEWQERVEWHSIDVWGKRPEELTLTYLYLATGDEVSFAVDDAEAIRDRARAWLSAIGAGRFEPTPGEHCRWCDFLSFCDAGKAFVGQTRP